MQARLPQLPVCRHNCLPVAVLPARRRPICAAAARLHARSAASSACSHQLNLRQHPQNKRPLCRGGAVRWVACAGDGVHGLEVSGGPCVRTRWCRRGARQVVRAPRARAPRHGHFRSSDVKSCGVSAAAGPRTEAGRGRPPAVPGLHLRQVGPPHCHCCASLLCRNESVCRTGSPCRRGSLCIAQNWLESFSRWDGSPIPQEWISASSWVSA